MVQSSKLTLKTLREQVYDYLRRELRLSDGFLGNNEPILHFGLLDAEVAPRVEVTWPSGAVDICSDLPALRTHVIKEGVGCLQEVPVMNSRRERARSRSRDRLKP